MREKETISILGGKGFLGNSLSKLLLKKNNIKICDIIDISDKDYYIDIEDPVCFKEIKDSSVIINLAALHTDNVKPISRYDDVNIKGSQNVCNAAENFGINKIIFTSSVAIYGFAPPNTDETGEANYFNDYGRTKFLAEQVYKDWQSKDPENRTLVIIRPTVIFGEGNRGNVFNLFQSIFSKKFIMVGNGENMKSMAYVKNVASFIEYSLRFESGVHIFNYIDKPDIHMNRLVSISRKYILNKKGVGPRLPKNIGLIFGKLADMFSYVTKITLPVSYIRVKKFISTTQFKSSIQDNTDFIPPYTLEEALIKTLNYEFNEEKKDDKVFYTE